MKITTNFTVEQRDFTFTTTNSGYSLNELQMTKEDLGLFFELLGFQVDYSCNVFSFGRNCMLGLESVSEFEFVRLFEDFKNWSQSKKRKFRAGVSQYNLRMSLRNLTLN